MNVVLFTYVANVIITSWLSISCIFFPRSAVKTIFSNSIEYSEAIRLVGCLWASILVLSLVGIFYPAPMALIFLVQALYKSLWILCVAIPDYIHHRNFPQPMALFFLAWMVLAPLAYVSAINFTG